MSRPQSVARSHRLARVLLSLLGVGWLAACAPNAPVADPPPSASITSTAPAASSTPTTATPTPTLPVPADGTDLRACRDGTCEVRVTGPTAVPLPARLRLGPINVLTIDAQTVTMVVPLAGSTFDSDGGCSATFTGPGAGSPMMMSLACHAGEKNVVNGVAIEVAGIADGAAVLRIGPAS
jgi:hypothetical protein